jgi:hypothetical protein
VGTPSRPILLATGEADTVATFGGVPLIPVDCDAFTAQTWLMALAQVWEAKRCRQAERPGLYPVPLTRPEPGP